ncbi:MAG TPA: hypothetical protein PLK77_00500 [Pyrinomonadaceae bacterium]|nr:hypothetical protein [Pyrinomonadaceae bacterium]
MKNFILSALFLFGLGLLFAGGTSAQTSVAGEWDGSFNTPGGERPFKFVLVVDGEKLTGTAKRPSGDVPLTGTIKGDLINFAYTINYGGHDLALIYSGKVSGDSMSGTISFGGQAEETWSAKRAAKQ